MEMAPVRDLTGYSRALRQLADDITVATGHPENWTNVTSAYRSDLDVLAYEVPEWGDEAAPILRRVIWDCGKFVSAIDRHAYGVAALLEKREVYLSIWPLLRAQLEAGGRLVWILEPHVDDNAAAGPKRRTARYFLEMLASVCYQHEALAALKSRHRPAAKRLRTQTVGEIKRLFGVSLEWGGIGSEQHWQIDADKYISLASGCDRFAKQLHGSLRGIYATLSGYSHPSLRFMDEILIEGTTSQGFRTTNWRLDIRAVDQQTRISAAITYRAATCMISYLDGRQDLLEAAMDRFESALGDLEVDV